MEHSVLAFLQGVKARLPVIRRPVVLVLLCLVMTGLISAIDRLLGYDLSLEIFYVVPVALVSWEVGKNAGILVAVLSGVQKLVVDEITRPLYVHPLMPLFKEVTGLCFLLLIAWLVAVHKRDEEKEHQLMAQLTDAAIAEERNRMAGEIHDTLAQGFTGVSVQLEAARDIIAVSPEEATQHMERAQAIARASLKEARRSVWALRPPELEASGLAGSIQHFLDRIATGSSTMVEFSLQGTPYPMPKGVALGLLRICQEAVVNSLRHAMASKIQVHLTYKPSMVDLCVHDDGRGFDSYLRGDGKGFGLIAMRERAGRIGAQLEISSEPGKGTRTMVVAKVPTQEMQYQSPQPPPEILAS
jgi:signal transduction histidine kinase